MNRAAAEVTVAALRASGAVEEPQEALVALVLGLASAVDKEPGNAALWREYRAAVQQLEGVGSGGVDDGYATLTLEVRGTKVVHAGDAGSGDVGAGGGGGGEGDGSAVDAVAAVGGRRRT